MAQANNNKRLVIDYDDSSTKPSLSIKELLNVITKQLAESFGNDCVRELNDDEQKFSFASKRLSENLQICLLEQNNDQDATMVVTAASALIHELWDLLKHGVGWTKPCFRECYVIAQIRLAICYLEKDDGREALKCLDMAVIMGCPGELAREFVRKAEEVIESSTDKNNEKSERLLVSNTIPEQTSMPKICNALEKIATDATWKVFKREYFDMDKPVQLTSNFDMPCIEKWRDLRYFSERFGNRLVPLEIGKYDDVDNWREEIITMEEFVNEHLAPDIIGGSKSSSDGVSYLAQHQLFEQIPQLAQDFEIPEWCNAGRFERCNVWLGTSGTVTPLHFDSYDNIFGQIVGYKFIRLYLESDSKYLYKSGGSWEENRSWTDAVNDNGNEDNKESNASKNTKKKQTFRNAQGNISRVDVENPNHEKFPEFKNAKPLDVILGPGDFIYIPSRTWHYVRSLTVSCSLNFLF